MSSLPDYCSQDYIHIRKSIKPAKKEAKDDVSAPPAQDAKLDNLYSLQRLNALKINYQQTQPKTPFVIGVAGGSASGKTTVCDIIVNNLSNKRVVVISQDSFYKCLSPDEKKLASECEYDFDHPDAFEFDLLQDTLLKLKQGKKVSIPVYDFKTHSRVEEACTYIFGADVIIIEGILIFYTKALRELMDMKIFIDSDADTRLSRRIRRDIIERGRDLNGILIQYEKFVKPAFDDYISPTKKFADIIIPRGSANTVAIDLLVQHIKFKLTEADRGFAAI